MKKTYKFYIPVVLAILILVGVFWVINRKEMRELVLTDFKQGQEYQFGELTWHSSAKEVENFLDCSLEDVTIYAPEEDYVFYDFENVVYVLDGYESKASIEFRADELVYIDFTFNELENPKEFFWEIVTVWQDQYGPESMIDENENTSYISYRWRTEKTQLAIVLDGEQVIIFLAFIS